MNTFLQDILFALRILRKNPGFTLIAVLTLALGLGANFAMFTIFNAALLRPLRYKDPDRIVSVFETYQPNGVGTVAPANFLDWRKQNTSFTSIAAYSVGSRTLQTGETPEHVISVSASTNIFELLGRPAMIGGAFAEGDDGFGKTGVVVISHELWQRNFGAKTDVLGKTIHLDGHPYIIKGVMPPSFRFPPNVRTDLWIPLQMSQGEAALRDTHFLSVIARLRPGVTLAAASAQMRAIVSGLATVYPNELKGRSVMLLALHDNIVGDLRPKLIGLMAAVMLVLLIACANLANLLLARAARRSREISIRVAVGAGKGRLVRQFLTESTVLALVAGVFAVGFAWAALRLILSLSPETFMYMDGIAIDWIVVVFQGSLALATGLLFGLAPAMQALRANIQGELREDLTSYRKSRIRNGLVIGEVALSLVLLVTAGLLIRSFLRLLDVQSGFDSAHVTTMHLSAQFETYPNGKEVTQLYEPIVDKVSHLPGVKFAGLTSLLPLQDWGTNGTFTVKGWPPAPTGQEPSAELRIVSTDYFKALGVPLIKGRFFSLADNANAPGVAIVNEALAKKYFQGTSPLGQVVEGNLPATIVGVVGDVRQVSLDQTGAPELYYPDTQAFKSSWFLGDAVLVVKSASENPALVQEIQAVIREADAGETVFDIETMDEVVAKSLSDRKLILELLSVFSMLAVVLSAVGLYGLMAYAVSQRTREFGVRLALGASNTHLFRLILVEQARLTITGIVLGLMITFLAIRYVRSALFGIAPTDLVTFSLSVVVIAIVGLCAVMVPAVRAARTAPIGALRHE